MRAKITHVLPEVCDLRTSGNGCYQSPPFLRPHDQKKWRLWGREWIECGIAFSEICPFLENHSLEFHEIWLKNT